MCCTSRSKELGIVFTLAEGAATADRKMGVPCQASLQNETMSR